VHLGEFICVSLVLGGLSSGVGVGVCLRYNARNEGFPYNTTSGGEVFGEINALRRGVCLRYNARNEGFPYNTTSGGFTRRDKRLL
jgi:uncharacterized membrane-anchored protein YitT (DUF2179 family)